MISVASNQLAATAAVGQELPFLLPGPVGRSARMLLNSGHSQVRKRPSNSIVQISVIKLRGATKVAPQIG